MCQSPSLSDEPFQEPIAFDRSYWRPRKERQRGARAMDGRDRHISPALFDIRGLSRNTGQYRSGSDRRGGGQCPKNVGAGVATQATILRQGMLYTAPP